MRMFFVSMFLLTLLLANFSFAAGASEASVQVTGYSVVPTTIYPGTKGYIQLTLENSGTGTASGIKVEYSNNYDYQALSVYPGDIDSGANSQVSVPFEIPTSFSGGVMLYKINVYYLATSGGGSSKQTTFSVPIVISQSEVLQVDTISTGKGTLTPGEKISVDLDITNTGGTINDLSISCPQNSSFSIDGSTRKYIGGISSNSVKRVTIDLVSSSLASVGQYLIPLTFTYTDALQNPATKTLYVGPVNVLDSSAQFKVSFEPLDSTEIGSEAKFRLTLENNGASPASAIVDVGSTSVFIPLGTSKYRMESVEPGKTATETVTMGISSSVSSGYYELPLNITLSTGKMFTQKVGIPVEATPEIKITGEVSTSTTGSEIVIQISNTGNTPIRSVYAVADIGGVRTDKFIGTMAIDDYSTMSISATSAGMGSNSSFQPGMGGGVPRDVNASQYGQGGPQFNRTGTSNTARVTVTFKDEMNQPHTVTQDVRINAAGTGISSFASRTTRSNGIIFGLDAIQLGGIVLVAAGAGYYLYRRRKKKKQVAEE